MTPDFEGILLLDKRKIYGHSPEGMFALDLPLGLGLWLVFYFVLRDPVLANLPGTLRCRLAHYRINNSGQYFLKHLAAIIVSLLAGIATHLLWDSLTHQNDWFPWLSKGIVTHGIYIEYFLMLQYLSSIVGLLLVVKAIADLPERAEEATQLVLRYPLFWPLVTAVTLLTAWLLNIYTVSDWQHPADFYINNTLCGLVTGLIAVSLLSRYFIKST